MKYLFSYTLFILSFYILLSTTMVVAQVEHNKTPPNSGYASVNRLKMYYEIYGNGNTPIVLIHGGGSTIQTTFGRMIPLLATDYKLIAVELQAHGRTADRNKSESFTQDADDVAGLLQHLQIKKVHVIGFSNGGSTTMQLAIRHPNLVKKIVVISAAYKRDGFISGFFDSMDHATLASMPQPLQESYLKVGSGKEGLMAMFEKDRQRMITFKDWSDDELKSIKAPALFMVSDHDVVTVDHTIKMANLVPGAALTVLPGIHGQFIGEICTGKEGSQMPQVTTTLIKEFLNK